MPVTPYGGTAALDGRGVCDTGFDRYIVIALYTYGPIYLWPYIVMAYIVMAYTVMDYTVMAYIVMA